MTPMSRLAATAARILPMDLLLVAGFQSSVCSGTRIVCSGYDEWDEQLRPVERYTPAMNR